MPESMPEQEVQQFLADRGIESLANHMVTGHDGQPVTLVEAIIICGAPVRNSIDATIETIREVGGSEIDIVPAMTRHRSRVGERAQQANQAPAPVGAGEK